MPCGPNTLSDNLTLPISRNFIMPTAVISFEQDAMRSMLDGSIGICLSLSAKPNPRAYISESCRIMASCAPLISHLLRYRRIIESIGCNSGCADIALVRVSFRCTRCETSLMESFSLLSLLEHDAHVHRQIHIIISTTKVRHPMHESLTFVRYCFFILYPNIIYYWFFVFRRVLLSLRSRCRCASLLVPLAIQAYALCFRQLQQSSLHQR